MSNAIPMEILLTVDPSVAKRAERVQFAVDLLQRNHSEADVRRRVQAKYRCSRCTAWRSVNVARDIA